MKSLCALTTAFFLGMVSPSLAQDRQSNLYPQNKQDIIVVGELLLEEAEKYMGMSYQWGGRNTKNNPGLDCLGLIFLPYSAVFDFDWRKIPVDSNKSIIENGSLGSPVQGLNGILAEEADLSLLQKGDVLFFLVKNYKPESKDDPLLLKGNEAYKTWHTALYAGKLGEQRMIIHAKPGDKVVKEPLSLDFYDALFVTRRSQF
ncbi:C40 family peptidase [Candidatus Woesearchaeota archaeon]|nr:C40 family peptidase [Candidatus Woesearchaeota archaeon]